MATTPIAPLPSPTKKVRKANGKSTTTKHSAVINFTEEEDVQLYGFLEQEAKRERRQLGVFILLALHKQFPSSEVAE